MVRFWVCEIKAFLRKFFHKFLCRFQPHLSEFHEFIFGIFDFIRDTFSSNLASLYSQFFGIKIRIIHDKIQFFKIVKNNKIMHYLPKIFLRNFIVEKIFHKNFRRWGFDFNGTSDSTVLVANNSIGRDSEPVHISSRDKSDIFYFFAINFFYDFFHFFSTIHPKTRVHFGKWGKFFGDEFVNEILSFFTARFSFFAIFSICWQSIAEPCSRDFSGSFLEPLGGSLFSGGNMYICLHFYKLNEI